MKQQLPAPDQGGPTETLVVERASASPRLAPARPRHARRATAAAAAALPVSGPLRGLQEWFASVIMHPGSVDDGVAAAARAGRLGVRSERELERIVTPGAAISAAERLGIYHFAYHARLIDCLADDYPTVQYALGEREFAGLAREVIRRKPSDNPNLNFFGRRLAAFCRSRACRIPHRAFVADLADLEWAMVEVLHAQAAPNLSIDALKAIPMERWGAVRFRPSRTVKLLRFAHPVNRFLQDFRAERQPAIPARRASATAVYRQGFTIWRMDLTRPMAAILDRLFAGETLAVALQPLAAATPQRDQQRVIQLVMTWFRDWVEGGFFAAFAPGRESARPRPRSVTASPARRRAPRAPGGA